MHFKNLIYFLAVSSLLFTACDRNRIFEKNESFKRRVWYADKPVIFQFDIGDIDYRYSFYYNIRNTLLYPYQNLYLKYSLEDTLGNVYKSELTNIQLFDSKTGRPYGKGLGDIFDHRYKVIDQYQFINPGTYIFKINHYMRPDSLTEILSIGLRIEKEKE